MTNANKVVTAVERPLTVWGTVTVVFAVVRMSVTGAGVVDVLRVAGVVC